ncbi:MAG: hypothetical protein AAFV45_07535 [Pseudomonadota bacterium]
MTQDHYKRPDHYRARYAVSEASSDISLQERALFNTAIGFCMGVAVSSVVMLLDIATLKTLLLNSERPEMAITLLYVFLGLAGAAFNAAIECAMADGDRLDRRDRNR